AAPRAKSQVIVRPSPEMAQTVPSMVLCVPVAKKPGGSVSMTRVVGLFDGPKLATSSKNVNERPARICSFGPDFKILRLDCGVVVGSAVELSGTSGGSDATLCRSEILTQPVSGQTRAVTVSVRCTPGAV